MIYTEKIEWFAQKVLPAVYDDSLSYYEVLAKLTYKINDLIERQEELEKQVGTLTEIFGALLDENNRQPQTVLYVDDDQKIKAGFSTSVHKGLTSEDFTDKTITSKTGVWVTDAYIESDCTDNCGCPVTFNSEVAWKVAEWPHHTLFTEYDENGHLVINYADIASILEKSFDNFGANKVLMTNGDEVIMWGGDTSVWNFADTDPASAVALWGGVVQDGEPTYTGWFKVDEGNMLLGSAITETGLALEFKGIDEFIKTIQGCDPDKVMVTDSEGNPIWLYSTNVFAMDPDYTKVDPPIETDIFAGVWWSQCAAGEQLTTGWIATDTAGKTLQTVTNDDGNLVVRWADAESGSGLPSGGSTGQILTKASDDDGDAVWQDPDSGLPSGGVVGQVLQKISNDNYDADWMTVDAATHSVPSGGSKWQTLVKASDIDYSTKWIDYNKRIVLQLNWSMADSWPAASAVTFDDDGYATLPSTVVCPGTYYVSNDYVILSGWFTFHILNEGSRETIAAKASTSSINSTLESLSIGRADVSIPPTGIRDDGTINYENIMLEPKGESFVKGNIRKFECTDGSSIYAPTLQIVQGLKTSSMARNSYIPSKKTVDAGSYYVLNSSTTLALYAPAMAGKTANLDILINNIVLNLGTNMTTSIVQ